jgi:Secretion system C-terminal sorting domain
MLRFVFLAFALFPGLMISAQQVDKVIISGYGGQHDLDVKNSFLIGYSSYDNTQFTGEVILYSNTLQSSFDYAVANDYDLIIRSTTGLTTGLNLAPNYPSIKLVMPAGSNSYGQVFFGDVINSPVVITGAGEDSNQTGYTLEFFSVDPITGSYYSSYSNGYIAGQLAYISNTLNCSFDSARVLAREYGSENGAWDFYNGFGKVDVNYIISKALPVELTSFTALSKSDGILLKWVTKTEVNNYGFEVERKTGDVRSETWEKIGFVEGNGNSNSPKEYSFTDNEISYGKYSYRLKQIDNDGKFEFSNIVEVDAGEMPANFVLEQNYPNPFNPSTTIKFAMKNSEHTTLKIYNLQGKEVAEIFNGLTEPGHIYEIKFDASGFPSGLYFYTLNSATHSSTKKMLLVK